MDAIGQALDWLKEKIQSVIGFFKELFGVGQQAANMDVAGGGKSKSRAIAEPYPS